jgi:hypothetical protein
MRNLALAVLSLFLVIGCSPAPDDETAKSLAMSYLSEGFGFDQVPVEKDMIKILKSFEREGAPVMTFQVGGMICDMPVLKTDQGWIARGISCQGSIYTPEQLYKKKKDQYLEKFREEAEQLKTKPPVSQGGPQTTGMHVENDNVFYEVTFFKTASVNEFEPSRLKEIRRDLDAKIQQDVCTNGRYRDGINHGIKVTYTILASDKTELVSVSIDKEKCSQVSDGYFFE